MVRKRHLGLWSWGVKLFAALVIAAQCMASEPAATAAVKKLVVPDDHATIQAAILAANAGDTIFIKAGTYHEAVDLKSGIKLVGEQRDNVILQFGESRSVVTVKDCTDVSISGLTVRHMTTTQGSGRNAGMVIDNSTVVVAQCRVADAAGSGVTITNKANATLNSCIVEGNGFRGIEIKKSTAIIHACEVARNKMLGIVLVGSRTAGTVRYCRISESKYAGLGFWLGATGRAEENDVWSNEVGIEVRDACEDVVLFKNHCHGNKRDGIQIHTGAQARAEQNVCEENAGRGIMVYGRGLPVRREGTMVHGKGTMATLEQNRCFKNGERGIVVCRGGAGALIANECAENEKEGIYIYETPDDVKVERNYCRGNQQAGITIYDTGGILIANNHCESNMGYGIYVRKTTGMVTASANRCEWNFEHGMAFANDTQSTVQNNVCSENSKCGISFRSGAHGLAQANACRSNRCPGIWVEDPNTVVTLRKNLCCANNDSGILFLNVVDGEAEGNICMENLWSGIAVRGEKAGPTLSANQCNNNGAWGIISWAGADPNVTADNETLDNWKGGIKHRPPSDEEVTTARQI